MTEGDRGTARDPDPRGRVGGYYLAGFGACVATALVLPWPVLGLALLWPALSLGAVSASYLGLGPRVYGKRHGQVPSLRWILLAPVLLGQRASLAYYLRRSHPWDAVTPKLLVGARLDSRQASRLGQQGITAVLDLTPDFSEPKALRALRYMNLPVLDLTAPSPRELDEAVAFVRNGIEDGRVYVHCKIGYSRSAAVVGAYLLHEGVADTVEGAVDLLRKARPGIVVRPEVWLALHRYAAGLRARRKPITESLPAGQSLKS
jgi:predicted protein tyrosine phosphatase